MADVVALGLGRRPTAPLASAPEVMLVELTDEAANVLPADDLSVAQAVRDGVAALAHVEPEELDDVLVRRTAAGRVLIGIRDAGPTHRALGVAARRRATNAAESLHAALLDAHAARLEPSSARCRTRSADETPPESR